MGIRSNTRYALQTLCIYNQYARILDSYSMQAGIQGRTRSVTVVFRDAVHIGNALDQICVSRKHITDRASYAGDSAVVSHVRLLHSSALILITITWTKVLRGLQFDYRHSSLHIEQQSNRQTSTLGYVATNSWFCLFALGIVRSCFVQRENS